MASLGIVAVSINNFHTIYTELITTSCLPNKYVPDGVVALLADPVGQRAVLSLLLRQGALNAESLV